MLFYYLHLLINMIFINLKILILFLFKEIYENKFVLLLVFIKDLVLIIIVLNLLLLFINYLDRIFYG